MSITEAERPAPRYRGIRRKAPMRRRLLERDGPWCWWCAAELDEENPPTLDHLVRHAIGGLDTDDNVVLACARCNNERAATPRCSDCGHRIRKWRNALWLNRREPLHGDCALARYRS